MGCPIKLRFASTDWVGAIAGNVSQDKATEANSAATAATNAQNLLEWNQSRGSDGSAILPEYMKSAEAAASGAAGTASSGIAGLYEDPTQLAANYQNIINQYQGNYSADNRLAASIASGDTTQQMISEAQPVWSARTALATQTKNSSLEALKDTLNQIDSMQAKKGFSGDSFGNRALQFSARRAANNTGAQALGTATLTNATEKAGLQQQGRNLQIGNIGLGDKLASAAMTRSVAPKATAASNEAGIISASQQPLSFFKINQTTGAPADTYLRSANNNLWSGVGSSLGSTASDVYSAGKANNWWQKSGSGSLNSGDQTGTTSGGGGNVDNMQ